MSRLIVSFTSYPGRIESVKQVLDSLYAQTLQADEIFLWLAEEEFPNKEEDLPKALQEDLLANRFHVRWCDNLGSHKKYFYAMQEYPDDIIVTVDDDTYYHPDSMERLMDAHKQFPDAVAACCTSLIMLDKELRPRPIHEWLFDYHELCTPSMLLMAIGVGGVLYPPCAVSKKVFDKKFILENCNVKGRICGDDILLKAGEMLNGTPVVTVTNKDYYRLPNTQELALSKTTPKENHKNVIMKRIEEHFFNSFDEISKARLHDAWSELTESGQYQQSLKSYWLSKPYHNLQKQLGYLALTDAPNEPNDLDCKRIDEAVQLAETVHCAYMTRSKNDDVSKAMSFFGKQILDIPGIYNLADNDITIRGLIEYDELLGMNHTIVFEGVPVYIQRIKNWSEFLRINPQSDKVYLKAFACLIIKTVLAYRWYKLKQIRLCDSNMFHTDKIDMPAPIRLFYNQMRKLNHRQRNSVMCALPYGTFSMFGLVMEKLFKNR